MKRFTFAILILLLSTNLFAFDTPPKQRPVPGAPLRAILKAGGQKLGGPAFDDSSFAPSQFASLCLLNTGAKTVNVLSYGASGNGVHDDTPAIRNAITALSNSGGGICYMPSGTYNVCRQSGDTLTGYDQPAIFTLPNNITMIGDHAISGSSTTNLLAFGPGLTSALSYTTSSYGQISGGTDTSGTQYVRRQGMFEISGSGCQIRTLNINGQAGWTGNYFQGGNPSTGDGWDFTSKAVFVDQGANVLLYNSKVINWRGEEVYCPGNGLGTVSVIKCNMTSTNADVISVGCVCLLGNCLFGNGDVYQGVENFAIQSGQSTMIYSCTANPATGQNGMSLLGIPGTSTLVSGCLVENALYGIQFDEVDYNVSVQNCAFTNCTASMITSVLGYYPSYPTGYSNFSITGNTNTGGGGQFFVSQCYGAPWTNNTPPIITNFSITNNVINGGSMLSGGFYGSLANPNTAWPGFVAAPNTYNSGAVGLASGTQYASWVPAFLVASASAPVFTVQPASQSVTQGQSVTFSVQTTGTLPISYQWGVSINAGMFFSNISGATSSSYTFTPASTDNGKQYQCTATNTAGATTSMNATLVVVSPTTTVNTITPAWTLERSTDNQNWIVVANNVSGEITDVAPTGTTFYYRLIPVADVSTQMSSQSLMSSPHMGGEPLRSIMAKKK